MNLFKIEFFFFAIVSLLFSDRFHDFFYLCLKSILFVLQRLVLKLAEGENDLHYECEVVYCNKLNL